MQVAQRIAAWLSEKPQHAVLGLALSLLLPFAPILTGAVMTMLVLAKGAVQGALAASAAAGFVAVVSLLTGAGVAAVLVSAAVYWVPAALVAGLLGYTRSLTLTVQVTAIVALVAAALVYAATGDPVVFWSERIEGIAAGFREMGLTEQADIMVAQKALLAPQMTVLMIATAWSMAVLVLVFGYWCYRLLPETGPRFGRFCDLDLGRIVALSVAVLAVLALVTRSDWLAGIAILGVVLFWVQGLALLHWLRVEGSLPVGVLVVAYGLLPILNVLLVMALAALGLSDAWFNYRARSKQRPER